MIFYRGVNNFVIWESLADLNFTILILAHNFIYIVLSVMSMKSTTISFKGFYMSIFITSDNRWLQIVLIGFILIWMVNLNSFAIYMIMRKPGWCAYTVSIYALAVFVFINTLDLQGCVILRGTYTKEYRMDLTGTLKGLKVIKLRMDHEIVVRKLCLQ